MPLAPPQGSRGQPGSFAPQGGSRAPWPAQGSTDGVFLYAGSPFSWTYNVAISAANPTVSGFTAAAGGYAVLSGALPSGITVHADTGVISGTGVGGVGAGEAVIRVTDTLTRTHDTTVTWTLAGVPGAVDLFTSAGYWANEGMQ